MNELAMIRHYRDARIACILGEAVLSMPAVAELRRARNAAYWAAVHAVEQRLRAGTNGAILAARRIVERLGGGWPA